MSASGLKKKLDDLTEVDSVWKVEGSKIEAAINSTKTYKTPVIGKGLEDRTRTYAVDLYTGLGEAGNDDKEAIYNRFRTVLGDNFDTWKDLIKRNRKKEADAIVAQSLEGRSISKDFLKAMDYHRAQSADDQIKEAKEVLGKKNYLTLVRKPEVVLSSLTGQKREAYKLK